MLNAVEISSLEKRWKIWRLKRILKILSIVVAFCLLIICSLAIYKYLPSFFIYEPEKIITTPKIEKPEQVTIKIQTNSAERIHAYEDKKNKTHKKVSEIKEEFVEEAIDIDEPVYDPQPSSKPIKRAKAPKPSSIPLYEGEMEADEELDTYAEEDNDEILYDRQEETKQSLIQIETQEPKIAIESSDIQNYSSLKERFYETENIMFALMLAEEYYHNKDYKNALKWSIRANNLNSSNERSWIIFAKSLAKNGSVEKAISTLKTYLRTNPEATEISDLIKKIKYGDY